jgi:GT2 family glycosyltransferase
MLSILIVNWNTKALLRVCLQSIDRFPSTRPYEVIVVDNASSDGSAEMVANEFPAVKLVASPVNTGYAKGNNLCFASATGDLLLTLNPDTEFMDGSMDVAIDRLESTPSAGCLGLKQVGLDGLTQRSVRGFPTVLGIIGDVTGLGTKLGGRLDSYRLSGFDYDSEQLAPQPMGTFLLFRRQALADIGSAQSPFDEEFPIFFNEVDLLYRLRQAGWNCLYTPKAQIRHHGGESTKQVRKSMIWESHKSLNRYLWKHHGTGLGMIALPFVSFLIFAAAFVRAKGYDAGFRA